MLVLLHTNFYRSFSYIFGCVLSGAPSPIREKYLKKMESLLRLPLLAESGYVAGVGQVYGNITIIIKTPATK